MMPDESTPETGPRCVFVYGTLRQTGRNDINRLQPAPRLIGSARVPGVLFHLGRYPGMTLTGVHGNGPSIGNDGDITRGEVHGEVYAIEPALEAVLDEIEGLGAQPTHEYAKREIVVRVHGQVVSCLVYEINPRYVVNAPVIDHGDWLRAVDGA